MEMLIALAISLIMAAQQPNVPVELRGQALQVASMALEYARINAPVEAQIAPQTTPDGVGGCGECFYQVDPSATVYGDGI